MRLLICGGREWKSGTQIMKVLNDLQPSVVIEGECRGADKIARVMAEYRGLSVQDGSILPFPADWNRYPRAAGHIRNAQMLKEGKPHLVVAFHNDIANSAETGDMLTKAEDAGILYCLVESDE